MDDLETEEVQEVLAYHRKEILKWYSSFSKKEIVDGQVIGSIHLT